jgi:hypothetical protein
MFERFPRELRDLIYECTVEEQPVYIASATSVPNLTTSRGSRGLLLTSKQIRAEYKEILLRRAAVVLCFNKTSPNKMNVPTSTSLSKHTRRLTTIIDLDGLREPGWQVDGGHAPLSPQLMAVIAQLERALDSFPNLESVDIRWWNDLSVANDRNEMAEWMSALVNSGLIETEELWFGYFGGKLNCPAQLRDHLISRRHFRGHTKSRTVSRDRLRLFSSGSTQTG